MGRDLEREVTSMGEIFPTRVQKEGRGEGKSFRDAIFRAARKKMKRVSKDGHGPKKKEEGGEEGSLGEEASEKFPKKR